MAGLEIQFEALDKASPTIQRLSQEMLRAAQRSDRFAKEIVTASNKADQALTKIPPKAKQAGSSINALSQAGQQLKSQLLGLASVAAVTAFFKSSVEAIAEEERAVVRLNNILKLNGEFTEALSKDIQGFARALQEQTGTSNETVLNLFSLARAYTGTAEQAKELAAASIDFAVAADLNVVEATRRLGRAFSGSKEDVSKFVPEINKLTKEQLAAGAATTLVRERFKGAAAELQQTLSGRIRQAANDFRDFREEVGRGLAPALGPAVALARQIFRAFQNLGVFLAALGAQLVAQAELELGRLRDLFTGTFQFIKNAATLNFDGARAAFAKATAGMENRQREFADKVETIWSEFSNEITAIHTRGSGERIETSFREASEIKLINQDLIKEIKRVNQERLEAARTVRERLREFEVENLELSGQALQARLQQIEEEKNRRLAALDELAQKSPEIERQIGEARLLVIENARLAQQKAVEELDFFAVRVGELNKQIADQIASGFGKAVADMILEGKSLQESMQSIFNSILRTAIETFTRIAVEAAIARQAASGVLGFGGGALLAGAFAFPILKDVFKFQKGGLVTKPTLGLLGEKGPEAVIPLGRATPLGNVQVTVQQTNNFTATGLSDEQVRQLMRRISEVTRSGAADGAELVKSILSKQRRFSGEAV